METFRFYSPLILGGALLYQVYNNRHRQESLEKVEKRLDRMSRDNLDLMLDRHYAAVHQSLNNLDRKFDKALEKPEKWIKDLEETE